MVAQIVSTVYVTVLFKKKKKQPIGLFEGADRVEIQQVLDREAELLYSPSGPITDLSPSRQHKLQCQVKTFLKSPFEENKSVCVVVWTADIYFFLISNLTHSYTKHSHKNNTKLNY